MLLFLSVRQEVSAVRVSSACCERMRVMEWPMKSERAMAKVEWFAQAAATNQRRLDSASLIDSAKPKLASVTLTSPLLQFLGHRHHDRRLSTPPRALSFVSTANMLSSTRSAASMALRGASRRCPVLAATQELTLWAAKPTSALLPYRAGSVAFLSNTSSNNATTTQKPGLVAGAPGAPPPMKQARREVPLPSQEGKKGAMQYALYVNLVPAGAGCASERQHIVA